MFHRSATSGSSSWHSLERLAVKSCCLAPIQPGVGSPCFHVLGRAANLLLSNETPSLHASVLMLGLH